MAKQKFTIAHDTRFNGKHVEAGSVIELDNSIESDVVYLTNLLGSARIVESDAAHKHLSVAPAEIAKRANSGAAPSITKPTQPVKAEEKKS